MQRRQFRFSILMLQAITLLVAVVLGIRLYIEPRLYWRDLWIGLFAIGFQTTVNWLICSAPWSARLAAIGFVLGVVVEFAALNYFITHDLIRLTPGRWTPEGWYPLALPVERLLVIRDGAVISRAILPAMFLGMALSGVVGCIMMLMSWSLWWAMCGRKPIVPRLSTRRP